MIQILLTLNKAKEFNLQAWFRKTPHIFPLTDLVNSKVSSSPYTFSISLTLHSPTPMFFSCLCSLKTQETSPFSSRAASLLDCFLSIISCSSFSSQCRLHKCQRIADETACSSDRQLRLLTASCPGPLRALLTCLRTFFSCVQQGCGLVEPLKRFTSEKVNSTSSRRSRLCCIRLAYR